MGGYGTWQLAVSVPDAFAAMIPVCGGGMYWDAGRLKKIPIWAFHGALDKTVLPEESLKMVAAVNGKGGKAKLTIYPNNAHDAWTDTYSNPEVYAWLLEHTKGESA
jgi:predicted peptidase